MLKLDPEHVKCKADYKQAKKLAKVLEKIEGVMGKDIEGKGRQKQLEREEQYATEPRNLSRRHLSRRHLSIEGKGRQKPLRT